MGWVKSTAESRLDALGTGALARAAGGSQAGGSSLPVCPRRGSCQAQAAPMSQDAGNGALLWF